LREDQTELSRTFAVTGGDKFADVRWRQGAGGAPILEGVLAYAECELESIHDAGDHELVTGRVVDLGVSGGHPLIFYRSGFGTFAS
jgi:flavin reductase (DIM6/NTAB) family NADH-FMN oxidoreductase RutF